MKYELHLDKSENNGIGGFSLSSLATNLDHRDYRVEISDQYVFSPEILNSFRIAFGTNYQSLSSANYHPLVIVQGAFSSGGAQIDEWRREPRTDTRDTLSYSKGASSWKLGVSANFHPFHTYNADNFGGTYTFASLASYEAQQPALFTITTGNPLLTFTRTITRGSCSTSARSEARACLPACGMSSSPECRGTAISPRVLRRPSLPARIISR